VIGRCNEVLTIIIITISFIPVSCKMLKCRVYLTRSLRRGSATALLLGLWDRTPQVLGNFSLMIVVCCQEETSASGCSFIQRIPIGCGVSYECDCEAP
jgi:hypothetical protein